MNNENLNNINKLQNTQNTQTNTLPTLTIQFNQPLKAHQLQSFRGAIIERALQLKPAFEAVGIATDIWHQHKNVDDKLHYRYPLIQYQLKQNKASITAIGDGVAALKIWLQHNNQPINWRGEKVQFSLLGYPAEEQVTVGLTQNQHKYRLYKWVALNQHQYEQYTQSADMISKVHILQQCLQNHLVALSFNLMPNHTATIKSTLIDVTGRRIVKVYDNNLLAFDVVFSTNLKLPHYIGIGKGVSLGFGKQQPLHLYQTATQKIEALLESA